jgi:PHD finger protein/SWIM zinc finger
LKKWNILKQTLSHHYIPKLYRIIAILAATINKYSPSLYQNNSNKDEYVDQILEHINDNQNELESTVYQDKNNWELCAKNNQELFDFLNKESFASHIDKVNIVDIATGSYGVKLSKRYLTHSIDNIKIYQHQTVDHCVKITGIKSRFKSNKQHQILLKFNDSTESDSIKWYCTCKTGARTTNPCSHILAVLILFKKIEEQCHSSVQQNNIGNLTEKSEWYKQIELCIKDANRYKEWARDNETFCTCNQNYTDGTFMVECPSCYEWFHPACIGQSQEEINQKKDNWICPFCEDDQQ